MRTVFALWLLLASVYSVQAVPTPSFIGFNDLPANPDREFEMIACINPLNSLDLYRMGTEDGFSVVDDRFEYLRNIQSCEKVLVLVTYEIYNPCGRLVVDWCAQIPVTTLDGVLYFGILFPE